MANTKLNKPTTTVKKKAGQKDPPKTINDVAPKKRGRPKKTEVDKDIDISIKKGNVKKKELLGRNCTCFKCGKEYPQVEGNFFRTGGTLYEWNDNFAPVCKDCINEEFDRLTIKFNDQELAAAACCHYLDLPFYRSIYTSINEKRDQFTMGYIVRFLQNGSQYRNKTFVNTLAEGELEKTDRQTRVEVEEKWSTGEMRDKNMVTDIIGYDPFEGYLDKTRRALFQELVKYLDEDGIEDDHFKVSQLVQLVNNNYQINQIDLALSRMNPLKDAQDIKALNTQKQTLVSNNDKIAKENEISVKNRSDKAAGRSTLTYLMRDLREKDFSEAEMNYYNQLRGEGSQWAADMSLKAISQNTFFDENDKQDMLENQRAMITQLQDEVDDIKEENRLLKIKNAELEKEIDELSG